MSSDFGLQNKCKIYFFQIKKEISVDWKIIVE